MTPNRNDPCPCGSGRKYKLCHSGPSRAPALSPAQQGAALLRANKPEAALPPLLAAIEAGAQDFETYHALGQALLHTNRLSEAVAILTHALTLRAGSAAAHADLAAAHDALNQHDAAMDAYRRAAELDPKLGNVQLRLGQLYALYSRLDEAADAFERAADAKPKSALGHMCRSDAELLRGNIPAAEHAARKAIAAEPKNPSALGGLASLLYSQGRFDDAATYFEQALRANPKSDKAWDGLVHCRKYTASDTAILDRLRATLRRPDLTDTERTALHFSLGKIFDDIGNYEEAMRNFDAANRLRASTRSFDRAALAASIDRAIAQFTPDQIARAAQSGAPDDTPVFIVGMYRSGTTLVEQILSSHPDIAAGGELTIWGPAELDPDPATNAFNPARTQAALETYLARLKKIGPTAARVTDKLPANFLRLGAIHALLPHARIIHCERDPVDVCLSIYTNLFSANLPFAARKADLVFYYRQYQRMMAHWRASLPAGALLEIKYEALIADRDAQTRRMIGFLGLDWNDRCLAPEHNPRAIGTVSAWQARQPVYATSLQRWRRYEPWLGELRQLLPVG